MRLNPKSEILGDNLFKLFKAFPMESVCSSIIYNSKTLAALFRYRDQNKSGIGPDIETDENHPMNAPADLIWIIVHSIFFWVLLIGVIEYRLLCLCCDPRVPGEITKHDNDVYFGREELSESKRGMKAFDDDEMPNEEDSDASEVAQIIGSGTDLKLRFNVKFKPREELALKVENLKVVPRQGCCAWMFCCKVPFDKVIVNSLAMQVQAGSKFAIIADSSQGKTQILETLTGRRSALKVSARISKQIGRGTPVYTCQQSDQVFFLDCTL